MSSQPYSPVTQLNYQNNKVKGTEIQNVDFCKGCNHNCESCFALRNSFKTRKDFSIITKVTRVIGKANPNFVYRLGNCGDPAHDWLHSETKAKECNITNMFCVTKLQSVEGFTGYFTRLQVSVDPFNPKHFAKTLKNVEHILKNYPQVQIVLRIRSFSSNNETLTKRQQEAVVFANKHRLPVLETRVRFRRQQESVERYDLNTESYQNRKGYLRPNVGSRFLKNVKKHFTCDLTGKSCKGCKNCINIWKEAA